MIGLDGQQRDPTHCRHGLAGERRTAIRTGACGIDRFPGPLCWHRCNAAFDVGNSVDPTLRSHTVREGRILDHSPGSECASLSRPQVVFWTLTGPTAKR